MTTPVDDHTQTPDFSAFVESMSAAIATMGARFDEIGRAVAEAWMPALGNYRRALEAYERAERIRRSQGRPLAIDGRAYRRRTRRRKP